jgi:hypothetical protein
VGVPVDLIVTLDPVDQTTVPKNVKLCVNYWAPGIFGKTNFLRGIPLDQEPGGTGKVVNVNLHEDGSDLREPDTNHINIDKAPKLHKAIIEKVLSTCPERSVWAARTRTQNPPAPQLTSSPPAGDGRTAGSPIGPNHMSGVPK